MPPASASSEPELLIFDTAMLEARRYWRDRLAGIDPGRPQALYPDMPGSPAPARRRATVAHELPAAVAARLARLTGEGPFLMHVVITAAAMLCVSKYGGGTDVVVGCPPRLQAAAGARPVANALAIREHLDPGMTFKQLLGRVRASLLDAYSHQQYPFSQLLDELGDAASVDRFGRRRVFDLAIVFIGLHGKLADAQHDLTLTVNQRPGAIEWAIEYNPGRYEPATISRFSNHLAHLLDAGTASPDHAVGELPMLDTAERRQLSQTWSHGAPASTGLPPVHVQFAAQAARTPRAVATAMRAPGGEVVAELRYAALDERANRLAHYLRAKGAGIGAHVGVLMSRSLDLPVAILGVLKAGAAYLPLDPDYPKERLAYILADACATLVLTDSRFADLASDAGAPAICLDTGWEPIGRCPATPLDTELPPGAPAYLIYTSGSTGRPKGCRIGHDNLACYLDWAGRQYSSGGTGTFALYSSLAFDLTVTSLYLPLLKGRTLYQYPQDAAIADILLDSFGPGTPVDTVKLTPAHIMLLGQLGLPPGACNVKVAIVGGEALTREHLRVLFALNPDMAIYNEYGPTEATVGCVVARMRPDTVFWRWTVLLSLPACRANCSSAVPACFLAIRVSSIAPKARSLPAPTWVSSASIRPATAFGGPQTASWNSWAGSMISLRSGAFGSSQPRSRCACANMKRWRRR
jgi:non-ribosomal peptide synthetase component F